MRTIAKAMTASLWISDVCYLLPWKPGLINHCHKGKGRSLRDQAHNLPLLLLPSQLISSVSHRNNHTAGRTIGAPFLVFVSAEKSQWTRSSAQQTTSFPETWVYPRLIGIYLCSLKPQSFRTTLSSFAALHMKHNVPVRKGEQFQNHPTAPQPAHT